MPVDAKAITGCVQAEISQPYQRAITEVPANVYLCSTLTAIRLLATPLCRNALTTSAEQLIDAGNYCVDC